MREADKSKQISMPLDMTKRTFEVFEPTGWQEFLDIIPEVKDLRQNGNGIQSVYLSELSDALAETLIALIGPEAVAVQEGRTPRVANDSLKGYGRSFRASFADVNTSKSTKPKRLQDFIPIVC